MLKVRSLTSSKNPSLSVYDLGLCSKGIGDSGDLSGASTNEKKFINKNMKYKKIYERQ